MNNDDLDLLLDDDGKKSFSGKRPVFLQVLCILTFVGAGLSIIGSIFNMLMVGSMQESMNAMNSVMGDMDDSFTNMYRWTKISYIMNFVGSLACLAGALIMWRLRKYGYYIYIFGQVLPLIGSFMVFTSFGSDFAGGMFASIGMISMVLYAIFPIAFVIMYGLNLKHMK